MFVMMIIIIFVALRTVSRKKGDWNSLKSYKESRLQSKEIGQNTQSRSPEVTHSVTIIDIGSLSF